MMISSRNGIILFWLCVINLLSAGPLKSSSLPATDLLDAAKANQIQTCKALIRQGADVNAKGQYGDTPLSWAVDNQNLELVRLLLAQGANPNVRVGGLAYGSGDVPGETPLIGAIRHKNLPIFRALMESKQIDVNGRADDGSTPLTEAFGSGYGRQPIDVAIVRALLVRGADPNLSRSGSEAPLVWACLPPDSQTAETLVRLLFEHGARVSDRCMFAAATSDKIEVFKLLIAHGGDLNAMNPAFGSLLKYAAERGQEEMVKFLVAKGAKIDQISRDGIESSTALMGVAHRFYFAHGNPRDTALYAAKQVAMLKLLLDEGADPNASNAAGQTVLMFAVRMQSLNVIKILIAHGAQVNARDKQGKSVMTYARETQQEELIQLLKRAGAM